MKERIEIKCLLERYCVAIFLAIFISGVISKLSHYIYLFASIPLALCFVIPMYILSFQSIKRIHQVCFILLLFSVSYSLLGACCVSESIIRSFLFILFYFAPFMLLCIPITPLERNSWDLTLVIVSIIIVVDFWYQIFTRGIGRWVLDGLFGKVNSSAALLNMLWPNLVLLGKNSKRLFYRFSIYCLALFTFISAILSFSRMAVFTAFFLLFLFINKFLSLSKKLIILFVICLLIIFFKKDFLSLLELFRFIDFHANYPRTLIWMTSLEFIKKSPFWGVGAGNAPKALSLLNMYHAHNNILQIALELGVPVAIIGLIFEIWVLFLSIRIIGSRNQTELKNLGIACGLLAWILYSITASPIEQPALSLLLVYFLRFIT